MSTISKFEETTKFIETLSNLIKLYKEYAKEFEDDKNMFMVKYINKICLKRFSIAIFGKMNTGKSTFLNLILGLKDFLEIKSDIATKFVCIIRHKKTNKIPEVFEAIPENRRTIEGEVDYFNFIKGKKVEGNINEIISKRNKEINDIENNNEIINEKMKYYLIVEANLTIFNEPSLEKYADLFEFLDIPGLDEGNLNNNVYFKDLIPVIIPNVAFSIFILDSEKIQDNDTSNIIQLMTSKVIEKQTEKLSKELKDKISKYIRKEKGEEIEQEKNEEIEEEVDGEIGDQIGKESGEEIVKEIGKQMALNSIYIINKIDEERIHRKDEYINIARNLLLNIFREQQYMDNIDNLNIIPLSAKNLLLEQNKYEKFYFYLEYILFQYKSLDKNERPDFKTYLSKNMKEFSDNVKRDDEDSSDSDSNSDDEEEEKNEEFNNLSEYEKRKINEVIKEINKLNGNFELEDYFKKSKKFTPNQITNKQSTKKTKELYNVFHKIMSNIIDNFNRIDNFQKLYKCLEKINGECKLYEYSQKLLKNYDCISDPLKLLEESHCMFKEELSKIKDSKLSKDNNSEKKKYFMIGYF